MFDERHVGAEDLPGRNLMRAVLGLEQSRTPEDGMRVAGLLAQWLRDPRDDGLKRAFTDWVWRLAGQFEPGDAESPTVRTLEGVRPLGGMVKRVSRYEGVADDPQG